MTKRRNVIVHIATSADGYVEFVNDAIGPFVSRLREQPGKDIWLMGGGELIASFLDEHAIDEFAPFRRTSSFRRSLSRKAHPP